MVCIFSQVTAELSTESVSCKLNNKKLQDVSHETGVKLVSYADSFSMVGDWKAINLAYSKLRELVISTNESSFTDKHEFIDTLSHDTDNSSDVHVSHSDEDDVDDGTDDNREESKAKVKENQTMKPTVNAFSNFTQKSRRVGHQMKNLAPEPIVICMNEFIDKPMKEEPESLSDVTNDLIADKKLERSLVDEIASQLENQLNAESKTTKSKSGRKSKPPKRYSEIQQKHKKVKTNCSKKTKTKNNEIKYAIDETKGSLKKRILLKIEKSQDEESDINESSADEKDGASDESTDDYELPAVEEESKERNYSFEKCVNVIKSGSKTNFQCAECKYISPKKGNLREHWQRNHSGKSYPCPECDKIFGIKKDLTRHLKRHFEAEHCCDVCGKFYKSRRTLKEHQQIHKDGYEKPEFACDHCDKKFSTKYVLSYHVESEHKGNRKSFLCMTCGKSFTQKGTYLQHANIHLGIKPYICDVCGVAFRYEKSLKEHKYRHDDVRRFPCTVCDKRFTQSSALAIHLKVHKEFKDYLCQTCGKGFTQRQALTRHERIHNGEKPFACRLCARCFNDASIIRRHMILLHKKDPKRWREDVISKFTPQGDVNFVGTNAPDDQVDELLTKSVSLTEDPETLATCEPTFPELVNKKLESEETKFGPTNQVEDDLSNSNNNTVSHYDTSTPDDTSHGGHVSQAEMYHQNMQNMYPDMSILGNRNLSSGNNQVTPYGLIDGQEFNRVNPWAGPSPSLYMPENLMYMHPNFQNYHNQS